MTTNEKSIQALMKLAYERLTTAKRDHEAKAYRDAATRAYYSMFHATNAILNVVKVKFKTHKSTVGPFGEHVVQAGLVESDYGRMLNRALDLRELADYSVEDEITEQEGKQAVINAEQFVIRIRRLLKEKYNFGNQYGQI